jgi:hypothetical protein
MRVVAILLSLALMSACVAGKPAPDGVEFVTRIGVITGKEVVEPEEAGIESEVSTGASVSMSSDTGLSIGIGWLLPLFSSSPETVPVRYHVKLLDGEPVTVYHDSDLFEVGDCVEISSPAGDDSTPPLMKRIAGGC